MAKYRHLLPQLNGKTFITDGGLETTLVFKDGIDLPCFAAFDLLRTKGGEQRLLDYYRQYASIAIDRGLGFVLESVTWRANPDWGRELGYSSEALDAINKQSISMLIELRDEIETETSPMVISGCIGPRGDGYSPDNLMTADDARSYHSTQIASFREADADMVTAMTINYIDEAVGIINAAKQHDMPVVISFTLETDGCLPTGETLREVVEQTDAATGGYAAYYMINCAHPTHFEDAIASGEDWLKRIHGIRANASCKSHAELDQSIELDDGDPQALGEQYKVIRAGMKHLTVFGGCCGTDHRHIEAICDSALSRVDRAA